MGKILGSWSGMRKYLETEMLAPSLRGRIRYQCTSYVGMDGTRVFELFVDGELYKRFSWETLNTYFIENGFKQDPDPYGRREYWAKFWPLLSENPIQTRPEYTDEEFCDALAAYRNGSIAESLASDDPIVFMFAVLDRRVGKRTLETLRETLPNRPEWIRSLYHIRVEAENH